MSSRASSNPSPMSRPVASKARGSFSGMAARRAIDGARFVLPHTAAKNNQMLDAGRQLLGQEIEMLVAFGQYQWRATFVNGLEHVVADELIAGFIRDQFGVQFLKLDSHILGKGPRRAKPRGTDMDGVRKRTCGRLCPGIDPMTNRPALHEDDRMVAIFAGDRRGQARDELRLCPADDLLETLSGQVVAFVNNQMSIICHQVTYHVLANQALDDRDVQRPCRLLSSAADSADGFGRQPPETPIIVPPIVPAIAGDARERAY